MVAVNCGAIPPGLVQAHLFGHAKGAFTGATRSEPGLVRAADGGTLLLDEVDALDGAAQLSLLRVIQERTVSAVGSSQAVRVDVRFVSATHEPLRTLCDAGRFRGDLLARLDGFSYRLRPLRERLEDLGTCVATILGKHGDAWASPPRFAPETARRLLMYSWPSNIRELEQCLLRCSALAENGLVKARHLPPPLLGPLVMSHQEMARTPKPWSEKDARMRKRLVELLADHDGNVTRVAQAMGKARMQVQRWVKRFEIDTKAYRSDE
jgi:DNA-binding NtrC family response regulator